MRTICYQVTHRNALIYADQHLDGFWTARVWLGAQGREVGPLPGFPNPESAINLCISLIDEGYFEKE